MPVPQTNKSDLHLQQTEQQRERQTRSQLSQTPLTTDAPVMRYRLLAGAHVGPDLRVEPQPVYNTATGEPIINPRTREPVMRRPSRQWVAGDIVEAEVNRPEQDLVYLCGANKFMLLGDAREGMRQTVMRERDMLRTDPPAQVLDRFPAKAPHGQVSSGYQEAAPGIHPEDRQFREESGVRSGGLSDKGREMMRQARDESGQEVDQTAEEANKESADQHSPQGQDTPPDIHLERQNAPSHSGPGEEPAPAQEQPRVKRQLPNNLNTMSARELREYAGSEKIDLKGATSRDEMIKSIRQSSK